MASTSGCSHQLKDFSLFDTCCIMGHSSKKSDFASATRASEADQSTIYFSIVEEQIERSKAHWSTLTDHSGDTDEEEVDFEVSNEQEFQTLQRHPTWGTFFWNFTGDGKSTGFGGVKFDLVVGKKFAEGGQAELYEAEINLIDPNVAEHDRSYGLEFVLKVFKKGTLLKDVKSQLPLKDYPKLIGNARSPTPKMYLPVVSRISCGLLLKSGRFAFLMLKQDLDLRTLIERNMKLGSSKDCGPFSKEDAEYIMYSVALGVDWLHNRDIVHRDMKASNVLVYEYMREYPKWHTYVADFECSIGVVGTNFFRAPEILQACKEKKVNEKPEVFSRVADVYSFGMTCYEILTGKLPFEDHSLSSSLLIDLVINQHLRPEVPTYVEDWRRELLNKCWQFDPTARPTIREVLNVFSTNSQIVRKREVELKKKYGENFTSPYDIEVLKY